MASPFPSCTSRGTISSSSSCASLDFLSPSSTETSISSPKVHPLPSFVGLNDSWLLSSGQKIKSFLVNNLLFLLHYWSRNRLDSNLWPFSSHDFYMWHIFLGIRNTWFRVFLRAFFQLEVVIFVTVILCTWQGWTNVSTFDFATLYLAFFIRKGFISNTL